MSVQRVYLTLVIGFGNQLHPLFDYSNVAVENPSSIIKDLNSLKNTCLRYSIKTNYGHLLPYLDLLRLQCNTYGYNILEIQSCAPQLCSPYQAHWVFSWLFWVTQHEKRYFMLLVRLMLAEIFINSFFKHFQLAVIIEYKPCIFSQLENKLFLKLSQCFD